jgi:hypothetical protein
MGTTHHRSAVLKRLRETIEKTKDPETLARLTAQYVKLNAQKRPRKSADEPTITQKTGRSLREIYTGSVYEQVSDRDLVTHHIVLEIEKRRRAGGCQTQGNGEVLEVLKALRQEEREAYEALKGN